EARYGNAYGSLVEDGTEALFARAQRLRRALRCLNAEAGARPGWALCSPHARIVITSGTGSAAAAELAAECDSKGLLPFPSRGRAATARHFPAGATRFRQADGDRLLAALHFAPRAAAAQRSSFALVHCALHFALSLLPVSGHDWNLLPPARSVQVRGRTKRAT